MEEQPSHTHQHSMPESESSEKEYMKFAGIIIAIIAVSYLMVMSDFSWNAWASWFMGMFFVVFSFFKLLDLKAFAYTFMAYDLLASRFKPYAFFYPFIELGLGFAYLFNIAPVGRHVVTVVVLYFGALGVAAELRKKTDIKCACLGKFIKLPLSTVSLAEDLIMGTMALAFLVF